MPIYKKNLNILKDLLNDVGSTVTSNGIAFTRNSDGSYTLNGTNDGGGNSVIWLSNSSNPSYISAGQYIGVAYAESGEASSVGIVMFDGASTYKSVTGSPLTFDTGGNWRFYIQVPNGTATTFSNYKVYPMFEVGTTLHPFDQCDNGSVEKIAYNTAQPVIPTYLNKVEYIEATGTQHIDSLVEGDSTVSVSALIKTPSTLSGFNNVFGSNTPRAYVQSSSSGTAWSFGASSFSNTGTVYANSLYRIEANFGSTSTLYANSTSVASIASGTFSSTMSMGIFARKIGDNSFDSGSSHRLYEMTMKKNGTEVRKFLPVKTNRASKNRFSSNSYKISGNGLTYTNHNGIINVKGTDTSTHYPSFVLYADGSVAVKNWLEDASYIQTAKGFFTDAGGVYTITVKRNGSATSDTVEVGLGFETTTQRFANISATGTTTATIDASHERVNFISLGFFPNSTNDVEYEIQIEAGDTSTEYEPNFKANEAGLYDLVGKEFYRNIGTGSFTAGKTEVYPKIERVFNGKGEVLFSDILPADYQEVSYIKNTTQYQYIDTGVVLNQLPYKIEIDMQYAGDDLTTDKYMGGVQGAALVPNVYSGSFRSIAGSGFTITFAADYNRHTHVYEYGTTSTAYSVDGVKKTTPMAIGSTSLSAPLFRGKLSSGSMYSFGYMKLYSAKYYRNGTLERYFVPCYRKADGKVGLFDVVNQSFHGVLGDSIDFEAGDVVLPGNYKPVPYLESTGAQWIDLGVKAGPNTVMNAKIELTSVNTNRIFGESDSSNLFYLKTSNSGNWEPAIGSVSSSSVPSAGRIYNVSLGKAKFIVDGTKLVDLGSISSYSSTNIRVFDVNGYDSNHGKMRLYSCQVYDGEYLTRDLRPCVRRYDNKPGLYDLSEGKFYVNQGTGEFTVGGIA